MMVCCHVDDLLVVGDDTDVKSFFAELETKVEVTYKAVNDLSNTTYLGRKLEVRGNEIVFGVDVKYVDNILADNGMSDVKSDLKGTSDLKWEKSEPDEPELNGLGQAEYVSQHRRPANVDRPVGHEKGDHKVGDTTWTRERNRQEEHRECVEILARSSPCDERAGLEL